MCVNSSKSGMSADQPLRRVALLVGTSEYMDPHFARLHSPAADVQALAGVFADPDICNFEVATLLNPTHTAVRESLRKLCADLKRKDTVVFYFSGHGAREPDGALCLAMNDTETDCLSDTSLTNHDLDRTISGSGAGQKLVILDCCHSGAYAPTKGATATALSEHFADSGYCVLASATAVQHSSDGSRPGELSAFTKWIVRGLRDGKADLNRDGIIDVDELYRYVHPRVIAESPTQSPTKSGQITGQIHIATNPRFLVQQQPDLTPTQKTEQSHLPPRDRSRRNVSVVAGFAFVLFFGGFLWQVLGSQNPFEDQPWRSTIWHVAAMSILTFATTVTSLTRRLDQSLTLGMMLATTTTSLWGLMTFYQWLSTAFTPPNILEVAGCLVLLLGLGMTNSLLRTNVRKTVALPRFTRLRTWILVAASGTASAPWFMLCKISNDLGHMADAFGKPDAEIMISYAAPSFVIGVLMFIIPITAVSIGPRLLSLSLLFTWILGSSITALCYLQLPEPAIFSLILASLFWGICTNLLTFTLTSLRRSQPVAWGSVRRTRDRHLRAKLLIAAPATAALVIVPSILYVSPPAEPTFIKVDGFGGNLAVSPDGLDVYVAPHRSGSIVQNIRALGGPTTSKISAGLGTEGLAVSPDGTRLYVALSALRAVAVIDTGSEQVIHRVGVDDIPLNVRFNPLKDQAYVLAWKSVYTIDTISMKTIGRPMRFDEALCCIAAAPDGRSITVAAEDSNNVWIIRTDVATSAAPRAISIGGRHGGVAMSANSRSVYVSNPSAGNISIIDSATGTVTASAIYVGPGAEDIAVSPTGHRIYVATFGSIAIIDTVTNKRQPPGIAYDRWHPIKLAISPDGATLYATQLTNLVAVIDVDAEQQIQ